MSTESWFKAVGSLTAGAISQGAISGGHFSGGRLLCGSEQENGRRSARRPHRSIRAEEGRAKQMATKQDTPKLAGPTPGPWVVNYVVDGAFEIQATIEGDTVVIASRGPIPGRHFEFIDNANLIAAAPELLQAAKELREALCAAMRVIAGIDAPTAMGFGAETASQRFVEEVRLAGLADGFGVRCQAIIAKADPSYAEQVKKAEQAVADGVR